MAVVESPDDDRTLAFTAEAETGERLDRVLVERLPDLTRSAIQRLIDEGHGRVTGGRAKSGHKLPPGERVSVLVPPVRPTDLTPEPIPLRLVFEGPDLLAINT